MKDFTLNQLMNNGRDPFAETPAPCVPSEAHCSARTSFEEELREMINRRSMEGRSNTPDFILAKYLTACLDAFTEATNERTRWFK